MAQINGILNGTDIKVYNAGTLIAFATSGTININHSPRSTSNKEDGGWESSLEGYRSFDVSIDAMYAWNDATGGTLSTTTLSELYTNYIHTRTSFEITFGDTGSDTGDTKYTGTVFMTSASLTAPNEDSATFSASFQGTGALTQTVAT
tara:strand:- start:12 stop:455 length:444 start_codon:yes stop_codon:yes gene_type:complete